MHRSIYGVSEKPWFYYGKTMILDHPRCRPSNEHLEKKWTKRGVRLRLLFEPVVDPFWSRVGLHFVICFTSF